MEKICKKHHLWGPSITSFCSLNHLQNIWQPSAVGTITNCTNSMVDRTSETTCVTGVWFRLHCIWWCKATCIYCLSFPGSGVQSSLARSLSRLKSRGQLGLKSQPSLRIVDRIQLFAVVGWESPLSCSLWNWDCFQLWRPPAVRWHIDPSATWSRRLASPSNLSDISAYLLISGLNRVISFYFNQLTVIWLGTLITSAKPLCHIT